MPLVVLWRKSSMASNPPGQPPIAERKVSCDSEMRRPIFFARHLSKANKRNAAKLISAIQPNTILSSGFRMKRLRQTFRCFHDEPPFNLCARPGCFAQKGQAGFHARVEKKTADRNTLPHFRPAVALDQCVQNGFECDAMQRVAWVMGRRWHNFLRS